MWPETSPHPWAWHRAVLVLTGLWGIVLLGTAQAQPSAEALALPPICDVLTTPQGTSPANPPNEPPDCFEFGAAVGELGLSWRQKLPPQVRWLQRQDAAVICQQSPSEFGQKLGPAVSGGCIFLAADACTVITPGYLPAALLSNAIRHCVP